jgi:hypothetical protein
MSTHATALILGVSNFVSLPAGETENRLLLQLPNGRHIEAIISDESLAAVAGCFGAPQEDLSGGPQEAIPPTPTPPVSRGIPDGAVAREPVLETTGAVPFDHMTTADGTPAYVFGQPPKPEEEPEPEPAVRMPPPPMATRKTRLVGKDNAGNPIVEVVGAVNPTDITGTTGDKDEDGVAQL